MSDEEDKPASPALVSITVTDVLGIGKAAETLAPAGQKIAEAVGRLVEPVMSAAKIYLDARAEGTAQRHETKANLKQINQIEQILTESPELAGQMKARLVSTEMRRQANLHAVTTKALELTKQFSPDAEVHDVDPDFVQEWIEGVKDVSDKDVQNLWAAILASAPLRKEGRISKPALVLLQQLDQPTAKMFAECAKVWVSMGPVSVKVPAQWAPFGSPVNMPMLEEIGFVRRQTVGGFHVTNLGVIMQVPDAAVRLIKGLHTLEIYTASNRAWELASTIFNTPMHIDDDLLIPPMKQYLSWLANDRHWALAVAKDYSEIENRTYQYLIRPVGKCEEPEQKALQTLDSDKTIHPLWREVLIPYARAGRLHINEPK